MGDANGQYPVHEEGYRALSYVLIEKAQTSPIIYIFCDQRFDSVRDRIVTARFAFFLKTSKRRKTLLSSSNAL